MKHKLVPVAAALLTALTSYNVAAESATDILTDGWEVHGYGSMNYRMNDGQSFDTEFGKPDYKTVGTYGKSSSQVEFVLKKHTEFANGVYSDFVTRTEYGNGDSFYYTSSGAEKKNDVAQLEIKEAYVLLGNLPYLPENSEVWAGRRFLNRAASGLSGEFWKQSSGTGAGFETKFDNGHRGGIALMSADPEAGLPADERPADGDRTTVSSLDFYYYGVQALGGSLDFDLKVMHRANQDPKVGSDPAEDGVGMSVTYNRDYYGFSGWSQTGLAYGKGLASNRGVNFGGWSTLEDSGESIFFTTYGVANLGTNWQMGSEITWFQALDTLFGAEDLKRGIIAVRPTYKVNDNFRWEFTGSFAYEDGKDGYWGRTGDAVDSQIWNGEVAAVFTVNADYFGRPQIKPYVSHIMADDEASAKQLGIKDGDNETVFGVHAEIWF
ncbi:carbohydrate porin [Photobacterium nomapromontoriensis]|uniref:carbohydrate porin n=1 Tax=Photobacterium nomapromontoriensis TaxID=2910237 RepID=UPI003D0F57F0